MTSETCAQAGISPEEISQLIDGQDELLDRALKRVRQEALEGPQSFFKHGDHGSHNSG